MKENMKSRRWESLVSAANGIRREEEDFGKLPASANSGNK